MMKQFFRKTMKNIATYVELVLSAFLVFVIAILQFKLVMPYIKKTLTYKLYNKYRYHKYEKCRQYQFHVGRYVFLIYGMTSLNWSITWNMPCRLL